MEEITRKANQACEVLAGERQPLHCGQFCRARSPSSLIITGHCVILMTSKNQLNNEMCHYGEFWRSHRFLHPKGRRGFGVGVLSGRSGNQCRSSCPTPEKAVVIWGIEKAGGGSIW